MYHILFVDESGNDYSTLSNSIATLELCRKIIFKEGVTVARTTGYSNYLTISGIPYRKIEYICIKNNNRPTRHYWILKIESLSLVQRCINQHNILLLQHYMFLPNDIKDELFAASYGKISTYRRLNLLSSDSGTFV